jgi:hypothetical protein
VAGPPSFTLRRPAAGGVGSRWADKAGHTYRCLATVAGRVHACLFVYVFGSVCRMKYLLFWRTNPAQSALLLIVSMWSGHYYLVKYLAVSVYRTS